MDIERYCWKHTVDIEEYGQREMYSKGYIGRVSTSGLECS